jgi:hypothetical protein
MNIEHSTSNIEHRSSDGLSKELGGNSASILETGNLRRDLLESEACRACTGALPQFAMHNSPFTIF